MGLEEPGRIPWCWDHGISELETLVSEKQRQQEAKDSMLFKGVPPVIYHLQLDPPLKSLSPLKLGPVA